MFKDKAGWKKLLVAVTLIVVGVSTGQMAITTYGVTEVMRETARTQLDTVKSTGVY